MRIGVDIVAIQMFQHQIPLETLASAEYWPHVSVAQICAALAYYHANKREIDDFIDEEAREYEAAAAEARRNGQGTVPER